ncbi:MAG: NAD-dependent epimerase/dehydratase family protein [Myxococcales bacterium]|nr:NAD-dependent epimerase/dehydratase family protein [Myxococcales bacterium]
MGKPVAVTGATGFIGSAVVRRLLLDGRDVRAILEQGAPTAALDEVEAETGRKVDRAIADVADFEGMRRALDGCASLHHLAAIYKTWLPDPTPIYRVNVEGTTATLLAAQHVGSGASSTPRASPPSGCRRAARSPTSPPASICSRSPTSTSSPSGSPSGSRCSSRPPVCPS